MCSGRTASTTAVASPRSRSSSRRPSPTWPRDGDYVARKFLDQSGRGYPSILLAAHGAGDRVVGFALADYFESIGYAYLDFIVAKAEQRGRGLGGALYEALREDLIARGANGLFLEVPTDDPGQVDRPGDAEGQQDPAQVLRALRGLPGRRDALRPADPPRQPGRAPAALRPAGQRGAARRRGAAQGHPHDPDPAVQLPARRPVRPPGRRLGQGLAGPDPQAPLRRPERQARSAPPPAPAAEGLLLVAARRCTTSASADTSSARRGST